MIVTEARERTGAIDEHPYLGSFRIHEEARRVRGERDARSDRTGYHCGVRGGQHRLTSR
jgi:hypothetical protein